MTPPAWYMRTRYERNGRVGQQNGWVTNLVPYFYRTVTSLFIYFISTSAYLKANTYTEFLTCKHINIHYQYDHTITQGASDVAQNERASAPLSSVMV